MATLLTLFFLLACSPEDARLAPLGEDAVVLAFGDSLTFGTGGGRRAAGSLNGYPAELEALIGRRVVNAGVPGEESAEGADRLPTLLAQLHPALVLLCHGGNDLLRRRDRDRLRQNLERMIEESRAAGAEVVLLAVPQLGLGLGLSPADLYEEVARSAHVPVETEVLSAVLSDRDLKSDPIHPNAAGYRRIAEAVAALLKHAGAL